MKPQNQIINVFDLMIHDIISDTGTPFFPGKSGICFLSHIHLRSNYENHSLWIYATFRGLPP